MNVSFLLHLYQPPTQDLDVTKNIAESCYLPLLKLIKQKKKFKVTLNISLSLLEQMDTLGYKSWVSDIKELYESERLELVGSAAYHPLLSKLVTHNQSLTEQQILLNEYAAGFYFGKDRGFEGEDALVIRDIQGFFPPELAVNNEVMNILEGMGYSWVLVDEISLPDVKRKPGVHKFQEKNIQLLVRNTSLSNLLSFKRDLNTSDFMNSLSEAGDSVIALDAEYFGHHHKEGIYLFDILTEDLSKAGIETLTCSEYVASQMPLGKVDALIESTWATTVKGISENSVYPNWDISNNPVHALQWELFEALVSSYSLPFNQGSIEGLETFPVWKLNEFDPQLNDKMYKDLYINLLVLKALNSDQFWWASNNPYLSLGMIEKSLQLYEKLSQLPVSDTFTAKFLELKPKILSAVSSL